MDTYTVTPIFYHLSQKAPRLPAFDLRICVPGSKSLTNRALMLAALADGDTTLQGIGLSDDSRHFIQCLIDLGFTAALDEEMQQITISGQNGQIPKQNVSIDVGSAGTAARFLTAMLGCCRGSRRLTSSEQMKKRPMEDLLRVLTDAGCSFSFEEEDWHFPFTITSRGIKRKELSVNIEKSSQFLSALLMACVLAENDIRIRTEGRHGLAYVRMTEKLMKTFGCEVEEIQKPKDNPEDQEDLLFLVKGKRLPRKGIFRIEPDISAACYFYAMSAISGGSVLVEGVRSDTLQGDIAFLRVLEEMGCSRQELPEGIRLTGPAGGQLRGVSADLSAFSDQALTLAAIAPFADSPVTITGIRHIRGQECDRIRAIMENLRRMGIRAVCSGQDDITIYPGQPQPAQIETFRDHRVAMSFALTGLRSPGIVIRDPLCCRKTFENYFTILDKITYITDAPV